MNELVTKTEDNIVNVDHAVNEWEAYQQLCRRLLDESDYQKITVKEKDENGNWIRVERQFPKKSAYVKLGRAFNVDLKIVERELERTQSGSVKEAYYCVRATLPNGRSVESDALCSRTENGKDKVSDHTVMAIAKTRATDRAIEELIGAGRVSAEELDPAFTDIDDTEKIEEPIEAEVVTANELKDEFKEVSDEELFRDEPAYATAGDVLTYATQNSDNTSAGILKVISKLHAGQDIKQQARELLIMNSVMVKKYDTVLTCKEICRIIQIGLNLRKLPKTETNYYKCFGRYFHEGLITEEVASKIMDFLAECKKNEKGEFIL